MTLDQVQALFGSPGAISNAYESGTGKRMTVTWVGAVTIDYWWWEGTWDAPEIEADFSMSKATTKTTYKRKKVKVKNVKRAKRLGLKTWRWKTVKVKKAVPATPYTVGYFSLSSAEILRQTATLECSPY
ncbi:MAG: hypothetical protein KDB06_10465 [Ilumatobacter sp.]|nr:hypothetical protein [Ilumatobacter sp.]